VVDTYQEHGRDFIGSSALASYAAVSAPVERVSLVIRPGNKDILAAGVAL